MIIYRRPGGDKIYNVFDNQLPAALKRLQFDKQLSMENIRKLITEADGYQPHLIAPEQGYRRLIESTLITIRGPAEAAVDAVSLTRYRGNTLLYSYIDLNTIFICPRKIINDVFFFCFFIYFGIEGPFPIEGSSSQGYQRDPGTLLRFNWKLIVPTFTCNDYKVWD